MQSQSATESFLHGDTKTFAVAYLLAHGLIKLGLVWELARKIVRAFEEARAAGKERARVDGALIEVPIYAAARRLLESSGRTPPPPRKKRR